MASTPGPLFLGIPLYIQWRRLAISGNSQGAEAPDPGSSSVSFQAQRLLMSPKCLASLGESEYLVMRATVT